MLFLRLKTLLIFILFASHCQGQSSLGEKKNNNLEIVFQQEKLTCCDYCSYEVPVIYDKKRKAERLNKFIADTLITYTDLSDLNVDSLYTSIKDPEDGLCVFMEYKKEKFCTEGDIFGCNSIASEVLYNSYDIIGLKLHFVYNYGGAEERDVYINLNTADSTLLKLTDIIKEDQLSYFVRQVKDSVQHKNDELLHQFKKNEEAYDDLKILIEEQSVTDKNLRFSVEESREGEGIRFLYDFRFKKQLYSYSSDLFFTFSELKTYLKEDFKSKLE